MGKIEVIGLGAGDVGQLPVKVYKQLQNTSNPIYVRTLDHPVVEELAHEGVQWKSFDSYYEQEDEFASVYKKIVKTLLEQAKSQSIIYAVPGHPMLAEQTVKLLLDQKDITVEIVGGQSYLDDLFAALQVDPIDGFQFVDATSFERDHLQYENHLVFCQVYDQMIASEVKLALLEDLPYDYPIKIVEAVGSEQEAIIEIPLEELDRKITVSNLTSIYISPVPKEKLNHKFQQLREVIRILRSPEGCEWDRKQTHQSLRPYLIEEVYELIDAIDMGDDDGIVEELGDVLLQIMLHSQIGEDAGYFVIDDVIKSITNKMIHRHPHVFGEVNVGSVDEVIHNWDQLKKAEKGYERTSILDGIAKSLPALAKAYELQSKAAKVGFDWNEVKPIWEKLEEELAEVKEAIEQHNDVEIEKEFGDVLFVIANLTRFYNIHPEVALNKTNKKFLSRFHYIEEKLREQEKDILKTSLDEMNVYWEKSKEEE